MNIMKVMLVKKLTKKIKFLKCIVFISIFYYLFSSIYVRKSISKDDLFISKLLNVDKECKNIKTFEEEIKCIKNVQESQLNLIKGTICRGKFINLGSKKFLKIIQHVALIEQGLPSRHFSYMVLKLDISSYSPQKKEDI